MTETNYAQLFKYNDGKEQLPKDAFKISPSSIEKFFSDKTNWYYENLLGAPKKFTGSTSTVLGTCVHACCEVIANAKMSGIKHDSDELHTAIEKYIDSYDNNEEYDTGKIHSLWKNMSEAVIKEYVLQATTLATEDFISHELLPGIFVAGSYDAITSTAPGDDLYNPVGVLTVRDYKTASTKPTSFSYPYRLQAFTYAYILRQKGINITQVELCYAVQPTKTIGVRTERFILPFDDQAYSFIEGILKLIAESVQCFKDYEDLRYLLAADYRLKVNDIPRP
jgi:hypothetical protein